MRLSEFVWLGKFGVPHPLPDTKADVRVPKGRPVHCYILQKITQVIDHYKKITSRPRFRKAIKA